MAQETPKIPPSVSYGREKRHSSKGWFIFIFGILLGVAGTLTLPALVGPYLPDYVVNRGVVVEGQVLAKDRQAGRLRLRVGAEEGVMLATFTENLEEIELLVEEGDTVALVVPKYSPFLDDPPIERVKKLVKPPPQEPPLPPEPPTETPEKEPGAEAVEPPARPPTR